MAQKSTASAQPRFETILKVTRALGLDLTVAEVD